MLDVSLEKANERPGVNLEMRALLCLLLPGALLSACLLIDLFKDINSKYSRHCYKNSLSGIHLSYTHIEFRPLKIRNNP